MFLLGICVCEMSTYRINKTTQCLDVVANGGQVLHVFSGFLCRRTYTFYVTFKLAYT